MYASGAAATGPTPRVAVGAGSDTVGLPPDPGPFDREHVPAGVVGGVGTALLGAVGWHLSTVHIPVMVAETDPARFVVESLEVVLMAGPAAVLLYLGYRVLERDFPDDARWAVAFWTLVGTVGVVGAVGAVKLHRHLLGYAIGRSLVTMELLMGAGVGGLLGASVGWNRAERELQAARVERQRDALLFLNRSLRHHVLNGVQIIDGYAAELDDRLDGDARHLCAPIRRRSEGITALVRNVRCVVRTFTETPDLEPVDLAGVVRSELDALRRLHDDAVVRAELASPVYVRSNDLLAVVVENLLDNAVRHNDADAPRISVTVEADERTGRVRIADNGPGIPEPEKERVTEPGERGDRGLGVYLADRIVTEQGGTLRIGNNDPRGTVVTVTLPAAAPNDGGKR
jgi:signal transduction histidine kinase